MLKGELRWRPIALLVLLSLIWGINMAAIKIAGREMAPLFMAGVRSLVASLCLLAWMRLTGQAVFPSRAVTLHGLVVGLIFGLEFAMIYLGLGRTLASRTYVLVYSAPFFVALGAHFWIPGDRLGPSKVAGLALAFLGVAVLLLRDMGALSGGSLAGDAMALLGGVLWGATTLYIKRYLVGRAGALQVLFYQLLFSAPLLFGMSLLWEDRWVAGFAWPTALSLFYQCIVVAFLSYLAWFQLVNSYPVSLLHAFSFFTPVFGVFISGAIMLGEPLGPRLLLSLGLVCLGMALVNRAPAKA